MSGPYDSILDGEEQRLQGDAHIDSASPYGAALDAEQERYKARLGAALNVAVPQNPDKAAKQLQLSRQTGLEPAVVERNEDQIAQGQRVRELQDLVRTSPVLARQLSDPSFAALAHDDAENLGMLESSFSKAKLGASAIAASVPRFNASMWGVAQAAAETLSKFVTGPLSGTVLPNDPMAVAADKFAAYRRGQNEKAELARGGEYKAGFTESAIYSGLESLGQNLLTMPAALATGNPELALYPMAASAGGLEFGKARDKNVPFFSALTYAASQATIEYATEKLPVHALMGDLKRGSPFWKTVLHQAATEIPGEQLATVLQDLNEWAVINPDKPFSSYLAERPSAAAATLISTVVAVGGQAAAGTAINHALNKYSGDMQRASDAERSHEFFTQLTQLLGASKLRERDPQSFAEFMQAAAEDGPVHDVYVNANVLMQEMQKTGVSMSALPATLAEQLPEATAANGDVRIPVGEYSAHVATSELGPGLLEHIKTSPEAMSKAEAEQFYLEQSDQFKQDAEQILAQEHDNLQARNAAESVKQHFANQLSQANRFTPEVNNAYASLMRDFYVTTAQRLGITPQEMLARYPLRVAAENVAADREMEQKQERTPEFKKWFEGSKVVDEKGQPLVLHHWTEGEFQVFSKTRDLGFHFGTLAAAEDRAVLSDKDPYRSGRILKVHLSVKNPLEMNDVFDGGMTSAQDALHELLERGVIGKSEYENSIAESRRPGAAAGDVWGAVKAYIENAGYDGVVYSNGSEDEGEYSYVAFRPEQIKSADNSKPTESPNLLEQSGRQGGDLTYTKMARELLDKMKEPPVLSTVGIVDGKEDAPRFDTNTDLAAYFTRKNRSKVTRPQIVKALYAEALHALTDTGNAVGWYDRKTRAALEIMAQVHPEILTDPESRFAFTSILAITSNGLRSRDNFVLAERAYREQWKAEHKFPESIPAGGQRASQMAGAFQLLNRLTAEHGWEKVRQFMVSRHSAKEVAAFAGQTGTYGEQVDTQLMGALFLGPKIGSYFNNLNGDFSTITMDRWFMRTINRVRGQMLDLPNSFGVNLGKLAAQVEAGADTYGVKAEKIPAEITAFGKLPAEKQADVMTARTKLKNTMRYAEERHRDFAKPRDDGTGAKRSFLHRTPENMLAKNIDNALNASVDTPNSATDRTWIRGIIEDVQARLRKDGIELTNADLQASLWYYEKDLYDLLKGEQDTDQQAELFQETQDAVESEDYETAARYALSLLREQGLAGRPADDVRAGSEPQGQGAADQGQPRGAEADAGAVPDAGGVRGSAGPVHGATGQDPRGNRPVEGLPADVEVPGRGVVKFGPFMPAREAAAHYMARMGLQYAPATKYGKVDPKRGARIAQAFDEMKHAPNDPQVKAAYDAMIAETVEQWREIEKTGLKVEFITGDDPYAASPRLAALDVTENNHLWVFPTDAGFGGTESAHVDISGNPLLEQTDVYVDGRRLRANDVFRIVHDYMGHIKEGFGFRAGGEDNAWQAHAAMYTPLARRAMTVETRGQNSWVNFGPFGIQNKKASAAATQYAPQKIGLLPEWASSEGMLAGPESGVPLHSLDQSAPVKGKENFKIGDKVKMVNGLVGEVVSLGKYQATVRYVAPENALRPGTVVNVPRPYRSLQKLDENGNVLEQSSDSYTPQGVGYWQGPNGSRDYVETDYVPTHLERFIELFRNDRRWYPHPQQMEQGTRGRLLFGNDITKSTSTIVLLKNADLSTFLHESGHFFLEVLSDIATRPDAPVAVMQDMQHLMSWFGVKDFATWQQMTLEQKRESHEKFARGFEAYLFEGKAPNVELQGLFARFRAWMLNVYQSLKSLNVQLTDEVRGVFDRMLASEEQIRTAEGMRSMAPVFQSAEDAGMTAAEWQSYQALGHEATEDAIRKLERRSLMDLRWTSNARSRVLKALQDEAAERRAEVRKEVVAEVEKQPVYQAIRFLTKGEITTDSEEIKALKGYKLDAEATQQILADLGITDMGPRMGHLTLKEGGLHPDTVAEMFGFTSGSELVRKILAADRMADTIDGMTDQRMLERYGDLTDQQSMERAADEAVHNEARARFVAAELKALNRAMNARAPTPAGGSYNVLAKAAKQFAERIIARKKVRDIRPNQYTAAETRAGKAAERAVSAGKTAEAAAEKRNQLVNNYAAKVANDALKEVERAVRYVRKFEREGTRTGLDADYVEQIDALLERFDMRLNVSGTELKRRSSLLEWVESQREQGFEPTIDKALLAEAQRQHYSTLTLEEFRGLVDAVKNIEHLGRLKKELLTSKAQREFAAVVEQISTSINNHATKTVPERRSSERGALASIGSLFRNFMADHRKFASVMRELDGWQDGGAAWEYFVRTMNDRGNFEAVERERATLRLGEIFKPILGTKLGEKTYIPAVDKSFMREEMLGIALNMGNEVNRERVLTGEKWSPSQLAAVLDRLSKKDWEFVQSVWDYLESFRPQIAEKQRRLTGFEPEWVEPTPVQTKHGEFKGGYYPIKYDPLRSSKAEADTAAEVQRQMERGLYVRAQTRRGHLEERVKSTGRPMRYDLGVATSHVDQVVHDLAWHEWLIDANRLLRASAIDGAIREHYGPEKLRTLRDTVRDIAIGDIGAQTAGDRVLNYLRHGATIVGLGWRLSTALLQPIGLTQSTVRIGAKWMLKGGAHWFGDAVSLESSYKKAAAKSDFMRLRAKTMQREINEIRNKVAGKDSKLEASYFYMITKMQLVADLPTWWGQYEKSMAEGDMTEERAIALADQAVIDAQGSGQIKDLAQVQRGSAAWKLFTNFYSFFNTTYNLTREAVGRTDFHKPKDIALLAADLALLYTIPALLGTLLKTTLKGDWDDFLRKMIADQLNYLLGTVVVMREAGSAIQAALGQHGGDYTGPASVRFFVEVARLAKQVEQGEADEPFWKALNSTLGTIFHYPAGQINATADGLVEMSRGHTQNPGVLITGAPKR